MSVKIRTFSKRTYTWFSEDITIIGDLFHSLFIQIREEWLFLSSHHPGEGIVLKHFNHILVATHKLAASVR